MKSQLYTRTGDQGKTSLYSGERVQKDDPRIVIIGNIHELNTNIGLAFSLLAHENDQQKLLPGLKWIMNVCFDIGADIATTEESKQKRERVEFNEAHIGDLEATIDQLDECLPKLTGFILPTGNAAAAQLHVCAAVCRRLERIIVQYSKVTIINNNIKKFINRLSDYLFVLARTVSQDHEYHYCHGARLANIKN